MKHFDTKGNFMVYGPQGERRAAFALDSDRRAFEALPDLLYCLERIISELPSNRDWLDPDLEAAATQAIAKAKGGES